MPINTGILKVSYLHDNYILSSFRINYTHLQFLLLRIENKFSREFSIK